MGDDGRVVGNIVPPNAPTLFQLHPESDFNTAMDNYQFADGLPMAIAHHVSNCDLSVLYHFEGINSYPPSRLVDLRNIMDPSDVVSHPNNGASLVF